MLSNDIAETNTSANIDRSAQLNLAIDVQRLPKNLQPNTPDERAEMLQNERQEVLGDIALQRQRTQAGFAAGLILLVLSIGQALVVWLTRKKRRA